MIALVEYSRLQFFLFSPLNLSCHSLLACRLCWKIHWQPYGVSLPSNGFLFAAFAILSLSLLSSILITMYPRVDPPGLICFEGSLCLLDLDLFPSSDSRKFSACFCKYSASLSCPPGIPIIECFAWWCYWVHDFHFFFSFLVSLIAFYCFSRSQIYSSSSVLFIPSIVIHSLWCSSLTVISL